MTLILICKLLGVLALLVVAVSLYGAKETIRIPFLDVPATPGDFGFRFDPVSFASHDGLTLRGWFIPADDPSPVTIMIQHGVGSNSGDMLPSTLCLRNQGRWNLFYYDFRGHGMSEGTHTSLGPLELEDFRQAFRYIRQTHPDATRRMGIYGHSMGAAVAITGAAETPELEGVIAENSFAHIGSTIRRFARIFYRIPYFPFVPLTMLFASWRLGVRVGVFAPVTVIGKIAPRPILMLHGELDRRMPKADVRALWEAAKEPRFLWAIPGAGHGDAWMVVREEYEKRLVQFFEPVFGKEKL